MKYNVVNNSQSLSLEIGLDKCFQDFPFSGFRTKCASTYIESLIHTNRNNLNEFKWFYGNASTRKRLNKESDPKVSLGPFPSYFKNYRKSLKN